MPPRELHTPPPCKPCLWYKRCWKCKPASRKQRRYIQAIAISLGKRSGDELVQLFGYPRHIDTLTGWEASQVLDRYSPRVKDPAHEPRHPAHTGRRAVCPLCERDKAPRDLLCLACQLAAHWQGSSPPRIPELSLADVADNCATRRIDIGTYARQLGAPSTIFARAGLSRDWSGVVLLERQGVMIAGNGWMTPEEFGELRAIKLDIGIPGLAQMIGHTERMIWNFQSGKRAIPRGIAILLRTLAAEPLARAILKVPAPANPQKLLTLSKN